MIDPGNGQPQDVGRVFRREYGRAVAVLTRLLGDIDAAEEAVQDAFAAALQRWPVDGIPPSPAGWILTTARNRAIDRIRRDSQRYAKHMEAAVLLSPDQAPDPLGDDRLRLIFTCCHPALSQAAQVALTLRLLGGLSTAEIARAFLVPEATMAQRIVRAKGKIRDAGIPYRIPQPSELPDRLRPVLAVLYLIFNEGYAASSGSSLTRDDLCTEAVRLARLLAELMPDEPEVLGLLALLLLIHARRPARTTVDGALVRLDDQDRDLWDSTMVAEGRDIVRRLVRRGRPGPYQIQAAINAVHSVAPTDWSAILTLYDQLLAMTPTPVVALHRAVAVAEVSGPAAALAIVDELRLDRYYLWHAIRADLLRRLGRNGAAVAAYDEAAGRTSNEAEQAFLRRARAELAPTPTSRSAARRAGRPERPPDVRD